MVNFHDTVWCKNEPKSCVGQAKNVDIAHKMVSMRSFVTIDLYLLQRNAKAIKLALLDKVKFIAVVKADGYGHGAEEVANAIYSIVDGYAVALVDEGISLRQAGIDKSILLLIPPDDFDIEKVVRYDLTVSFLSLLQLKKINAVAKRLGVKAKVALAVNTGMNRLGFSFDELPKILDELSRLKHVELTETFSHYYKPEDEEIRNSQTKIFKEVERLVKEKFPKAIAHISASGGTLNREYFDAVRVGIMLYGYYPYEVKNPSIKVKPIMSVYAPVVKNRALEKNSPIMYGDFLTKEDIKASIIRFGYADGLPRKSVYGQLNNRCMDLTAVKNDTKNKYFCILRKNAHEISKKYGTISYEVLTSISKRAKRIYKR